MGKKFVGLGGLKHFWTKAKTWIAGQITSEVTAKIAEIVANAPEDLDTLKEIADWIKTHANDASAMNTQINTNKNDIAALQTSVAGKADTGHTHDDRYYTESEVDKKLAGKSNVKHTHTKSEITDFAHTHDDRYFTETEVTNKLAGKADKAHTHSAGDITSGVLPVANGGTGVTTQAAINRAFIGNLDTGESDVTDGTEFVSSYASNNGFAENAVLINTPYKRKFSAVWGYIKSKISSVLGLTKDNYGGKASTAGTADKAKTADKVASAGTSSMWIEGRANAICKTTSAGESNGWKTLASIKTRYGSIEIGNLSGEDYVRIVYSSDSNVNAGNNDVSHIMQLFSDAVSFGQKIYANAGIKIPTSRPSNIENGDIWIE